MQDRYLFGWAILICEPEILALDRTRGKTFDVDVGQVSAAPADIKALLANAEVGRMRHGALSIMSLTQADYTALHGAQACP